MPTPTSLPPETEGDRSAILAELSDLGGFWPWQAETPWRQPPEHPGTLSRLRRRAADEMNAFVKGTLGAFAQGGLRLAAHTLGVGPVYEVGHLVKKGVDAIEAVTSDDAAEMALPYPVANLDVMFRVRVKDGQGERLPPVSVFIAPGDGSAAAAVELAPAGQHDEEHSPAEDAGLGDHAEARSKRPPIPDAGHAPGDGQPADDEPDQPYGQVVTVAVNLGELKDCPRTDRLAILQSFAVRKLRPFAIDKLVPQFTGHLALVICYDPAMGIVFWVRLNPDLPRVWFVETEFNAAGRLVIKNPVPFPPPQPPGRPTG